MPLFGVCVGVSDRAGSAKIAQALQKYARQKSLVSLANPNSPLNDAIKLEIIPSGASTTATATPSELEIGDSFNIRLTNVANDNCLVYLVVAGSSGAIQQVYPPAGSPDNMLRPGESIVYPPSDGSIGVAGPQGSDTYKLIVTNKQQDFSNWNQEGIRGGGASKGIAQLLDNAYHPGIRTRNIAIIMPDPPDAWGVKTLDVSIVGRKSGAATPSVSSNPPN